MVHPYFQNAVPQSNISVASKNPFAFGTKTTKAAGMSVLASSSSAGQSSFFDSGSVDAALSLFDFQVTVFSQ
jgi:hypothetical protein